MENTKKKVLFVVGPTGSGKSDLSFRLAKRLRGEIISADSMQVYRGMNIGTDKPSRWKRHRLPHHLLDVISPSEEFSVYEYRKRVLDLFEAIHRRKRLPVVAGGTGLYVKGLVDGISPQPGKDEALRQKLRCLAQERGSGFLYERLQKEDPAVATRIHPRDEKRIIRALEVLEISGRKLSDWEKETVSLERMGYRYWMIGIRWRRDELYERIDQRVDQMFRKGLLREARKLWQKALSLTARQAIGYRELFTYFEDRLSLEGAKAQIKQHTRNLAKRQMIWFKRDTRIQWLDSVDEGKLSEIVKMISHA